MSSVVTAAKWFTLLLKQLTCKNPCHLDPEVQFLQQVEGDDQLTVVYSLPESGRSNAQTGGGGGHIEYKLAFTWACMLYQ